MHTKTFNTKYRPGFPPDEPWVVLAIIGLQVGTRPAAAARPRDGAPGLRPPVPRTGPRNGTPRPASHAGSA